MIVIVDHRTEVRESFVATLERVGYAATPLTPGEFEEWNESFRLNDSAAYEGILLGDCEAREALIRRTRRHCDIPLVATLDVWSLEQALGYFGAGADDVVRKPIKAQELLARFAAIARRQKIPLGHKPHESSLKTFSDGRDPEINGIELRLPRRERRILECLVAANGRRVTREGIFNAVYGSAVVGTDESVIESHISKLRKKLRETLGHDPINSQRFLGYQLDTKKLEPHAA